MMISPGDYYEEYLKGKTDYDSYPWPQVRIG